MITPSVVEHDISTFTTPYTGTQEGSSGHTLTPGGTGASLFANRQNAGEFVVGYNNDKLSKRGEFVPSDRKPLGMRTTITTDIIDEFDNLQGPYRYMYTSLEERARVTNKHFIRIQSALCQLQGLSEDDLHPVGIPSQSDVWVCGRICSEAGASKLTETSIVLEGSRESRGRRVALDLSILPAFSFFPGQIVLIEGVNSTGRRMVAKRVVEGASCPVATTPPGQILEFHHSPSHQGGQPLQIMVAAGPFTTSDNLSYTPLNTLLGQVIQTRPDVVILLGPFVDITQPLLASGEVTLEDDEHGSHAASYEMVFIEKIMRDNLMALLDSDEHTDLPTQFILIPSLSDAHHEYVYPQPPFGQREAIKNAFYEEDIGALSLKYSTVGDPKRRVHLMSNPAVFRYGLYVCMCMMCMMCMMCVYITCICTTV